MVGWIGNPAPRGLDIIHGEDWFFFGNYPTACPWHAARRGLASSAPSLSVFHEHDFGRL